MSGGRRCKYEGCRVRVTSDHKYCENHDEGNAAYTAVPFPPSSLQNDSHFLSCSNKINDAPALTLPTDSAERKTVPLYSGCLAYFPAALAGVAKISYEGNKKHNPGQPLHHARGKSTDHADCILRHLVDLQDLLAREKSSPFTPFGQQEVLREASSLCWRALALSQELHERFGAPLAPGAKI